MPSFHACFQIEIVAHRYIYFINVSLGRALMLPGLPQACVLFKDLIILTCLPTY